MPHAAAFHHHPHAGFYPRPPPKPRLRPNVGKFYHPRDHAASPFFRIVWDHFAEFEKVYPERFRQIYGFWRPVIRSSIEKFLKCGDLKEGFARVRCPNCKEEFFVAFSCRQRACCPSCDQSRSVAETTLCETLSAACLSSQG